MRTIVINTSKEAINTKLDVLFKAPFDQSSLLWYEGELADIGASAEVIKQTLINDTDAVDRDYNLIVLVDLYAFPRGNERNATRLYKALLARYIGASLVKRLNDEFSLLPAGVAVYFADSAQKINDWNIGALADDNPIEQQDKIRQELLQKEKSRKKTSKNEDLSDDGPELNEKKTSTRSVEQRLIMDLFAWSEDINKDGFSWLLKSSVGSNETLDLSAVFESVAGDIKRSHRSAKVLELAIEAVESILPPKSGEWNDFVRIKLPFIADYGINCITVSFERDNEQTLIEGFFNVFANIFTCVQTKTLSAKAEAYSMEKIREMLLNALKKYKYFSDEKNISVEFEPIAKIFEIRESIFKARRETAHRNNKYKDKTPEEVAEEIMSETAKGRPEQVTVKMHGIDREFYGLVEDIFNNYDSELIKEQNSRIVKDCLTGLWNWRDKQTCEDFRRTVDEELKKALAKESITEDKSNVRETVTFIEEQYEKEYTELVNEVTEAEHRLSANKNILLETKNIVLKYGDLMRKGKWYLISFIGALLAIAVSILPYIYTEYYSGNDNIVFKIMYLLFTAGFACLYGFSVSVYAAKIHRKKSTLVRELEELKLKSESERKESIAALYKYYSKTVIETESHCLLWREILRRDRNNSKKGIKRNNHIKHLEFLIGAVQRFMTMLKFEYGDRACELTAADIKRFADEGLCLNAEESFHSAANQKVYSVLSEPEAQANEGEKEE